VVPRLTETLGGAFVPVTLNTVGCSNRTVSPKSQRNNTLRGYTINLDTGQASARFGRLTEKALDAGGVVEYYPAHHWLPILWLVGDVMVPLNAAKAY
jgi:hypothetical protein